MIELPLAFVGGLLGSSHCIGMCGGFAVSIGIGKRPPASNLWRQCVYSAGRTTTYAFLGAVAGFCGLRLTSHSLQLVQVQAALSFVAGLALIVQGLHSAGWLSWGRTSGSASPCLAKSFFAPFLTAPGLHNVFIAGLLTGLLPCGLVYAYLALAASSRDLAAGAALMVAFGAGTAPLMIIAGFGASLLSISARRHILKLAACCVIVTGALALSRGAWFMVQSKTQEAVRCPACQSAVQIGAELQRP